MCIRDSGALVLDLSRNHCLWHLDCRRHDRRWFAFGLDADGDDSRCCGPDQSLFRNPKRQNRIAPSVQSLDKRREAHHFYRMAFGNYKIKADFGGERITDRNSTTCLLYTSDAADDLTRVDLG